MRLGPEQARAMVAATHELAGPNASVRLFGSRLHDTLKGGDTDLLVQCAHLVERPVWLAAQTTARLQRLLGDRWIDVLLIVLVSPRAGAPRGAVRRLGVQP